MKIISTIIYVVYSLVSIIIGFAGIIGEPTAELNSLFGLFFAKVLAVAIGALILYVWYKVTEYLKKHDYVNII